MTPLLDQLIGEWYDDAGSQYTVTLDEDEASCTVRTLRESGRIVQTPGILKYSKQDDCILWGKSYYMEMEDEWTVHWQPLNTSRPYTWYRSEEATSEIQPAKEAKEEAGEEAEEAEEEQEGEVLEGRLEQIAGNWRDPWGTRYFITLDPAGTTCSATIVRRDGSTRLVDEAITYSAEYDCLYWNQCYYSVAVGLHSMTSAMSVTWKSLKSEETFAWERSVASDVSRAHGPATEARDTLRKVLGEWQDEAQNRLSVTLDESGESCSVRTDCADGGTRFTKRMLTYDREYDCVMWGKTYYMTLSNDPCIIMWKPLQGGKPFSWQWCGQNQAEASRAQLARQTARASARAAREAVPPVPAPRGTWKAEPEPVKVEISFGKAKAALNQVVGEWVDEANSQYTVSLVEAEQCCNVKTVRKDGHTRFSPGKITYNPVHNWVMWAASYYLALENHEPGTLCWNSLHGGKPFVWSLRDKAKASKAPSPPLPAKAEAPEETVAEDEPLKISLVPRPRPNEARSAMRKVLGQWRDEAQSQYFVSLDATEDSCSVKTFRADGRVRFTKAMLRYDTEFQCVMWGRSYYLDAGKNWASISWVPLKNTKPYTWHRC